MSNYTKSTDFTAKDSLPSGDSQKVIRGSEFDTEFSAIATAVNSKADKSGDTVVLTAGTVSAPSLTTVSDTNTGIYFPAADNISLTTSGTQRVTLDSSGRLGVGTGSPVGKLQINDGSGRNVIVTTDATQIGTSGMAVGSFNDNASAYAPLTLLGSALHLATGGLERARIDSSGNLGIGTTSPSFKLHIANNSADAFANISTTLSTAAAVWRAQNSASQVYSAGVSPSTGATAPFVNNSGYVYTNGSGGLSVISASSTAPITFYTNETERLRIDSSGNLGVGTSSPPVKLSLLSNVSTNNVSTPLVMLGSDRTDRYASINSVRGSASTYLGLSFSTSNNAAPAEVMTLDSSGNLGLGVTPSTWSFNFKALQVVGGYIAANGPQNLIVGTNTDGGVDPGGSGGIYKVDGPATKYQLDGGLGGHRWYTAPSGTAGDAISFTQAMTLDASGKLGINTTSPTSMLDVSGINTGSSYESGEQVLTLRNTSTSSGARGAGIRMCFGTSNSGSAQIDLINGSTGQEGSLSFGTRNSGGTLAERARITSDGDFLVGTTATTGSQTNTTNTVVGKITSNNGTVSAANNTATTMLSVSAEGASTFLVTVSLVSTDIGSTYTVLGLLRCGGATDTYTNILTATNLTVALSGSNLQVTQTSGLSATVTWSLLRLL